MDSCVIMRYGSAGLYVSRECREEKAILPWVCVECAAARVRASVASVGLLGLGCERARDEAILNESLCLH